MGEENEYITEFDDDASLNFQFLVRDGWTVGRDNILLDWRVRDLSLEKPQWLEPVIVYRPVVRNHIERYSGALECSNDDLQRLVDQLWEAGIRPRAAKGSAGQLDAVQDHLNDMRVMAFSALDINKPD